MPTFFEVLKGMQEHLSGTITGRVGIVPAPSAPLSDEPPPYATVAPGVQGDGIHTQSDFRHPKAGKLLVTAWAKPNTASDEEDTQPAPQYQPAIDGAGHFGHGRDALQCCDY